MQIDMTRPNTARVIDYWLGGVHNFEIDRQFGDQVAHALPIIVEWQRVARATLERVIHYMICQQHLTVLVDFGAGLPTCDNTHVIAGRIDATVRVLYDDLDPLTCSYGKQLIQGLTGVAYVQGDAQYPVAILENDESQPLLAGERRVGFIYAALTHLMTDEQIRKAALALYDWAAPGSCWYLTQIPPDWETDPTLANVAAFYNKARVQFYCRTDQELIRLLEPWRVEPENIAFNQHWGVKPATPPVPPLVSVEVLACR